MKDLRKVLSFYFLLSVIAFTSQAQRYACKPGEVAFYGNDLVSYYENSGPVKGKPELTYIYDDLKLQFATRENLEKFKTQPKKYLPEYNGWCAIAIANGTLAEPDFNHFKIQDGKLLFFEVRAFFNGKTLWEKDPDINKIVADKKFKELVKEK